MKRVLFVCGKARVRSPTAAQVFANWEGIRTDFGGISTDAGCAASLRAMRCTSACTRCW